MGVRMKREVAKRLYPTGFFFLIITSQEHMLDFVFLIYLNDQVVWVWLELAISL